MDKNNLSEQQKKDLDLLLDKLTKFHKEYKHDNNHQYFDYEIMEFKGIVNSIKNNKPYSRE